MEDVVKYPGREASADACLMSVTFQELSRNERIWRDVARMFTKSLSMIGVSLAQGRLAGAFSFSTGAMGARWIITDGG